MNEEIARAIERIGDRSDSGRNDLDSVKRTHLRLKRRRRFTSAAVALGLIGSGTLAAAAVIDKPSDCPIPKDYPLVATLSSQTGAPGTEVTVTGAFPYYQQDGTFDASQSIEVWWNANPDKYWELTDGGKATGVNPDSTVEQLGEQPSNTVCDFEITFTVPDVPDGKYNVVILERAGDGMALYDLGHTFDVTDAGE